MCVLPDNTVMYLHQISELLNTIITVNHSFSVGLAFVFTNETVKCSPCDVTKSQNIFFPIFTLWFSAS